MVMLRPRTKLFMLILSLETKLSPRRRLRSKEQDQDHPARVQRTDRIKRLSIPMMLQLRTPIKEFKPLWKKNTGKEVWWKILRTKFTTPCIIDTHSLYLSKFSFLGFVNWSLNCMNWNTLLNILQFQLLFRFTLRNDKFTYFINK